MDRPRKAFSHLIFSQVQLDCDFPFYFKLSFAISQTCWVACIWLSHLGFITSWRMFIARMFYIKLLQMVYSFEIESHRPNVLNTPLNVLKLNWRLQWLHSCDKVPVIIHSSSQYLSCKFTKLEILKGNYFFQWKTIKYPIVTQIDIGDVKQEKKSMD